VRRALGPERDSFFQLDSEHLFVAIGADGLVARVEQSG
jgi:hypothetical protein